MQLVRRSSFVSSYDAGPGRPLAVLLAAFFVVSVFLATSASAETRTLRMYFTHTKESATITFKKNGRYVKSGLRKANRFLRDWRRKEPTRMDPALLDLVWEVYQASGGRRPIHVISGYRSPKTNSMLRRRGRKVAKTSQHVKGKALDFFIPGVSVKKLRALGLRAHRGGVGYYSGSFVHLDTGRVRHWPRMSRRQLARVFPRGKTIHVPSDGRPLKGYKVAMANLKRGLNANGKRRKTKVGGSLLARIFTGSGNGGDEDEKTASRKRKRQPAKKPVAAKPVSKPAKPAQPVLVAKAEPKKPVRKKKSGPDPFSLEATAAADERPVEVALAFDSLTVPQLRPQVEKSAAEEAVIVAAAESVQKQEPPTALALATPPAALGALVPATDAPDVPSEVALVQPSERDIADLTRNTATALGATRGQNAAQSAAEAVVVDQIVPAQTQIPAQAQVNGEEQKTTAPTLLGQTRPSIPLNVDEFQVAALPPQQYEVAIPVAAPRLDTESVQQAELTPESIQAAVRKDPELITKPLWRKERLDDAVSAAQSDIRVPLPSHQPASEGTIAVASLTTMETGAQKHAEKLALGNLDGRSVKFWATAETTRVGAMAQLHAPNYKNCHKLPVPAAVYAVGFTTKRVGLRADRFTGSALQRLALTEYQISMR